MKPNLMTVMTISTGLVFVGAISAFLLYVPVLNVATVSAIVLALIVMFGLGVLAGGRGIRLRLHRATVPHASGTITVLSPRKPAIIAASESTP